MKTADSSFKKILNIIFGKISKSNFRKVKCPLCRKKIPAAAQRCSYCTADLTTPEVQKKIDKQLPSRFLYYGCIIFMGIVLFNIFGRPVTPQIPTTSLSITPPATKPNSNTSAYKGFKIGDEVHINNWTNAPKILIAKDEETLNIFLKSEKTDKSETFEELRLGLLLQEKMFGVEQGTKGKVLALSSESLKVQILEGEMKNEVGWINKNHAIN